MPIDTLIGMDIAWIVIGCLILLLTFLDTFLAVLNYDEAGILVNRIVRWQWLILRSFTRRVSRRWRPMVLRQVTGILIITTILSWIVGIVLAFTFIYLGLIGLGAFQLSKGVGADFVGALYLSFGQFSTVGADNVSPAGGWVNLLPVLEALSSVVLLSFIIAFLSNIYGVIQSLRSLCADFFSTGAGVGSPIQALQPYFPDGRPRDLDRHLNDMVNDFNLYCDGLRQDHSAYLFQSGDDQFSLPFSLSMTSGVVGALRWGLPSGHEASKGPSLVRLTEAFDEFRERRYQISKWQSPAAPTPLTRTAFGTQLDAFHGSGSRSALDPWALRFFVLNDAMADTIRASGPVDADDAHLRYTRWLPFAHHALQFTAEVSRDLDYQPIYRGIADAPDVPPASLQRGRDGDRGSGTATGDADTAGLDAGNHARPVPARPSGARRTGRFAAWLRRSHLLLDPGNLRLLVALRTLAAVVIAVAVAVPLSIVIGLHPVTAGVFAGLIALFAAPSSSGWGTGFARGTGILAIIPVALGILIGTLVPRNPVTVIVELAIVATAAVWLGRFGPRFASFGRLAFIAFYFALLLAVGTDEIVGALIAAIIGVLLSWVASLMPGPSARRQIQAGVDAITEHAAILLDSAIDVVSAIGGDRTARVLRSELAALRRSAMALAGFLDPEAPPAGELITRVRTLRLRVFDVELAAENLTQSLPDATDYTVTVDQRAVLAGAIAKLQPQVQVQVEVQTATDAGSRSRSGTEAARATRTATAAPADWPTAARRLDVAITDLAEALSALRRAERSDTVALDGTADVESDRDPGSRSDAGISESASSPAASRSRRTQAAREQAAAIDRRAVQVGVSTALALVLGGFVSTSNQLWAAMPAFQTLSGSGGESRGNTVRRIIASVAGATAAFGLALVTGHTLFVAIPVLAISVFFMSFLRPVASSWTSFWQTVLLATMYDVLGTLKPEAIDVRILETIIGAVVAILISAVLLPIRTRARVLLAMTDAVATVNSVVHQALLSITEPRTASAGQLTMGERTAMNRRFREIQAITEPLRHDPGALQRGGIETQLTSLTALLSYTRHLLRNVDAVTDPTVPADQWRQLDGATADNFASTLAVLDDRLPARVHEVKELTAAAGVGAGEAERQALLDIERINQTLLAYMASVKPGSTV